MTSSWHGRLLIRSVLLNSDILNHPSICSTGANSIQTTSVHHVITSLIMSFSLKKNRFILFSQGAKQSLMCCGSVCRRCLKIVPISPPTINGTVSRQLRYAIWLSEIFIWCVKTNPLWSFTQAVQRFTTSHQHPLSWLHLWASCFTAAWCFEWGCLMLLQGEGHCIVKNCRTLDPGLNLPCLLMAAVLFCLLQQDTTLTILCRIGTTPDSSINCRTHDQSFHLISSEIKSVFPCWGSA